MFVKYYLAHKCLTKRVLGAAAATILYTAVTSVVPPQSSSRRPPAHCSSPPPAPPAAALRKRTPSGRFMDTLNPLLSFSSDDIADMDREVINYIIVYDVWRVNVFCFV